MDHITLLDANDFPGAQDFTTIVELGGAHPGLGGSFAHPRAGHVGKLGLFGQDLTSLYRSRIAYVGTGLAERKAQIRSVETIPYSTLWTKILSLLRENKTWRHPVFLRPEINKNISSLPL